MNPDCQAEKHRACGGDAWDEETDERVPCSCPCHTEPWKVGA